MKREVVKLITPGTLLEPLDQHANYLLSVYPSPSHLLGLAWIDLSTATFQVTIFFYYIVSHAKSFLYLTDALDISLCSYCMPVNILGFSYNHGD